MQVINDTARKYLCISCAVYAGYMHTYCLPACLPKYQFIGQDRLERANMSRP